jgi:flagellar basal body-associated protein FliL
MMTDPTEPKKASTGWIIMVILGGLMLCCVGSTLIFLMIRR